MYICKFVYILSDYHLEMAGVVIKTKMFPRSWNHMNSVEPAVVYKILDVKVLGHICRAVW